MNSAEIKLAIESKLNCVVRVEDRSSMHVVASEFSSVMMKKGSYQP